MTFPLSWQQRKNAWTVVRRVCLLLGVVLLLTQCSPNGDNGNLSPPAELNPQLESEAVENLLMLYRTALLQGDIDRLQELTQTETSSVQSNIRQQQLSARGENACISEIKTTQALLDCTADMFRRGTILDVHIPAEAIDIVPDRSRVSFVEYQTLLEGEADGEPATLGSRTRAFRTTFDLLRGEREGTATFRIAAVRQEGPLFEVSTPGQIVAGVLARIEVASTSETYAITAVEVEVPETEITQLLVAADGRFHGTFTPPTQAPLRPLRLHLQLSDGQAVIVPHRYRLRIPGEGVVYKITMDNPTPFFSVTDAPDGSVWFGGERMRSGIIVQVAPDGQNILLTRQPALNFREVPQAPISVRIEDIAIDELGRVHALYMARVDEGVIGNGVVVLDREHQDVLCGTVNAFDTSQDYPFVVQDPQTGNKLASPSPRAIAASGGKLWLFGSDGGVAQVDASFSIQDTECNDVVIRYSSLFRREDSQLLSNIVPALVPSQDKTLWFGTAFGLTRWHDEQFTPVPFDSGLSLRGDVTTLEAYFQAVSEAIFNARPLTAASIGGVSFADAFGTSVVKEELIFSAVEDIQGRLWVGTLGGGIRRIEGIKGRWQDTLHLTRAEVVQVDPASGDRATVSQQGLGSNIIFALATGPDGAIWAATDKGASHIRETGEAITIRNFSAMDGLEVPVRDVAVDASGTAWLATDKGAFRIATEAGRIEGIVQDSQGNPLLGSDVIVMGTPFRTVTGADGRFELLNLPAGMYVLQFIGDRTANGPVITAFRQVTIHDSDDALVSLEVALVPPVPGVSFDPEQGGLLTFPHAPDASLNLPAQAVHLPPDFPPEIAITLLPLSSLPLPLPQGFTAVAAADLRPHGITFTKSVTLALPNQAQLPAGQLVVLLHLDDTTLRYREVGTGRVSDDRTVITATNVDLPGTSTVVFVTTAVIDGAQLVILSGNAQRHTVGTQLPEPLVVALHDAEGKGIPDVPVAFRIVAGNGALTSTLRTTDTNGRAQTALQLGTTAGINRVEAHVVTLAPQTLTAIGIAGQGRELIEVSGNNQVGSPGESLPEPLVVRLEDQFGNPVAGEAITAEVIEGEAELLSSATVETDAQGEARFSVRVESTKGVVVVQTSVRELPQVVPVQFRLTIARTLVGRRPLSMTVADLNLDDIPDLVTTNEVSQDISILLGRGDGTFEPQKRIAVDSFSPSVAVGDLNGDDIPDLVTANSISDNISILHGRGDGTFVTQSSFDVGDRPVSVIVADLNRDGNLDVVTANAGSDNISILHGQNDGTFVAQPPFDVGNQPTSVVVADLNRDGNLDVVTANASSDDISILHGQGDGTFAAQPPFDVSDRPESVVVANLNGDEFPDLVTVHSRFRNISILLGQGDGTVALQDPIAVGDRPESAVAADFNGDGFQDIVTANFDSNDVSVLLSHGDGTFTAQKRFIVGDEPISVVAADFDRDGHLDLATANFNANDVSILLGRGDGTFTAQQRLLTGQSPIAVTVGDLDGDGILDLVTANSDSDDISILLGRGNGTFMAQSRLQVGDGPRSVIVADLNDNGILDLITANSGP